MDKTTKLIFTVYNMVDTLFDIYCRKEAEENNQWVDRNYDTDIRNGFVEILNELEKALTGKKELVKASGKYFKKNTLEDLIKEIKTQGDK